MRCRPFGPHGVDLVPGRAAHCPQRGPTRTTEAAHADATPLLAENSLFKLIGEIFHPLFELFGLILAGLYAVWPNYGFAITGLTSSSCWP